MRKPRTYKSVTKDAHYFKIIQRKPINLLCQMVEFRKFAETMTAIQAMSYIIWSVKCVSKEKHILGKQQETIGANLKLE